MLGVDEREEAFIRETLAPVLGAALYSAYDLAPIIGAALLSLVAAGLASRLTRTA